MLIDPPDDDEWSDELAALAGAALALVPSATLDRTDWADLIDDMVAPDLDGVLTAIAEWLSAQLGVEVGELGDWSDTARTEMLDEAYGYSDRAAGTFGNPNGDATSKLAAAVGAGMGTIAVVHAWGMAAEELEGVTVWRTRGDANVRESHRIGGERANSDGLFTLKSGFTCTRPRDPSLPKAEWAGCRCRLALDVDTAGFSHRGAGFSTLAETNRRTPVMANDQLPTGFQGAMCFEGLFTSDDRWIDPGALTTREMPGLPFWFMNKQGPGGHMGSELAGRLETLARVPQGAFNIIDGSGVFDTEGDMGATAARQYAGGFVRGVSADLDMTEVELRLEDGTVLTPWEAMEASWEGERVIIAFLAGRIMGMTGTAEPAFDETRVEVVNVTPALTAAYGRPTLGEFQGRKQIHRLHIPFADGWGHGIAAGEALVASRAATAPVKPGDFFDVPQVQPAAWYGEEDQPDAAFGFTCYNTGQVDGYVYRWGDKHPANGRQVLPSACSYADAYDDATVTITNGPGEDPQELRVCRIYFDMDGLEHPDVWASTDEARADYKRRGRTGALVRFYEDEHGIRAKGGVEFGITNADFAALKGSSVSVDMRSDTRHARQDGEVIAVVATPRPAFKPGDETVEQARARHADRGQALVASKNGGGDLAEMARRIKTLEALVPGDVFATAMTDLDRLQRRKPKFFTHPDR